MKEFIAKEGMWLTQRTDVGDDQRDYAKIICTSDNTPDDFYRDATEEEKMEWEHRIRENQEEFDDSLLSGDGDEQDDQEY